MERREEKDIIKHILQELKKTFIDSYDINKKTIVMLYKHNTTVDVVGATLNGDKTLLGMKERERE
jgi:ribosomal protein L18E